MLGKEKRYSRKELMFSGYFDDEQYELVFNEWLSKGESKYAVANHLIQLGIEKHKEQKEFEKAMEKEAEKENS